MRVQAFDCVDSMWLDALATVLTEGATSDSRNGASLQIFGTAQRLESVDHNFVLNPVRNMSPFYASAELLWYLSGSDHAEMMTHYAPSYAKYAEDDGHLHGAYGKRISYDGKDQVGQVVKLIRDSRFTRQAVVSMWDRNDLDLAAWALVKKKDLPCTVCWQFAVQRGKLDMSVYMRSNDLWLGFPYDVYCFTSFQRLVASELCMEPGAYTHMTGSCHLYGKDVEKAQKAMCAEPYLDIAYLTSHEYQTTSDFRGIESALNLEDYTRRETRWPERHELIPSPLLADQTMMCATHNTKYSGLFDSPLMQRAHDDFLSRRSGRRGQDDFSSSAVT